MARDRKWPANDASFATTAGRLQGFAAGSFGFVVLGAFLIYSGASASFGSFGAAFESLLGLPIAAIGLAAVAFFGMILIVAIGALFDRAPVVAITMHSIHDRRWGGPLVPWCEVRAVRPRA